MIRNIITKINMTKEKLEKLSESKYDIIVIGAGSGGLNVASFTAAAGLRTLLIDKSGKHIGGDCLNTGCVPSKALIHISKELEIKNKNIKDVTDYIKSKQDYIRENENPEYLKKKNIIFKSGVVKFVNEKEISLDGEILSAKNYVLATGSRARKLSMPSDHSLPLYNNENIFEIKELPKRFIFMGGGPINCELGQSFARLGCDVTIINSGEQILSKEIKEARDILEETFQNQNIKIINNADILKIENKKLYYNNKENYILEDRENDEPQSVECDAVFVGIGRVLNIDNLDLEKAGVEYDKNKTRLIVDKYLRTTNKNIHVVGDVAGKYMFTHAAEMHAKIVLNNIFSPIKKAFDNKYISWVTFTQPEIATFGLSETVAENKKLETIFKTLEHDDRAITDEDRGFVKLYIDKAGLIHGGTIVSNVAGEISQEVIMAMSNKIPLSKIFEKVYAYPTAGRIIKSVAQSYMTRFFTDNKKKLLRI